MSDKFDILVKDLNRLKAETDSTFWFITVVGELGHLYFFKHINHNTYSNWLFALAKSANEQVSSEELIAVCDRILKDIETC